MTTKITLTYGDAELVVTGEYIRPMRHYRSQAIAAPSEFEIERIEQSGSDVTEHYRRMRLIPTLEDMAREVIESD